MKNTFHRLKEKFKGRNFNVEISADDAFLNLTARQKEPDHILSGALINRALDAVDRNKYLYYIDCINGKYGINFHKRLNQ